MVESSPSRQRRPSYKTNQGMSDEAVDAAALTYLLTICDLFSLIFHCWRTSPKCAAHQTRYRVLVFLR